MWFGIMCRNVEWRNRKAGNGRESSLFVELGGTKEGIREV